MSIPTIRSFTLDHERNPTVFRDFETLLEENDQVTNIYTILKYAGTDRAKEKVTKGITVKEYFTSHANSFLALFTYGCYDLVDDKIAHIFVWTEERQAFFICPVAANADYVAARSCCICLDNRKVCAPEYDKLPCGHTAHVLCMKLLARQKLDPTKFLVYNTCAACESQQFERALRLSISCLDFTRGEWADDILKRQQKMMKKYTKKVNERQAQQDAQDKKTTRMIIDLFESQPKSKQQQNSPKSKSKKKNKKKKGYYTLTKEKNQRCVIVKN